MSAAGLFLIGVPIAFNGAFAALAKRFDYPGVLRHPSREVLAAFRAGGTPLELLWWGFALTAVLLAPTVVLFAAAVPGGDPTLLSVATTVGVLAATVQFLGLIRWPFLVPLLARVRRPPHGLVGRRAAHPACLRPVVAVADRDRRRAALNVNCGWVRRRVCHPRGELPTTVLTSGRYTTPLQDSAPKTARFPAALPSRS